MPKKIIQAPGDTRQKPLNGAGGTDWDERHALDGSSGVSVGGGPTGNRITQARKSGSNYLITRGALVYDYRTAGLPQGIKIVKAHLFIGATNSSAADTGGDKLRIGVISNPTNAGVVTIAATDYDLARYDSNSYTSAQTVTDSIGARAGILELDNSNLLRHIEKTINAKGILYLGIRNETDFQDDASGVTGINRAWFAPPHAQGGSFHVSTFVQLHIFYRIINNQINIGGGGIGRASTSGFGGTNLFCGTSSGFGHQ